MGADGAGGPAAAWAAPVARRALDASEPGADGLFTVTLTLYDSAYKGIIASRSYDPGAAVPADAGTGEPHVGASAGGGVARCAWKPAAA
jgi:hypothetical protein